MVLDLIGVDFIAVIALSVSIMAFAERFRGSQRARQEANILMLSNQLNMIYDMVDENLADVLRTRGKVKLKNCFNKERFIMLQQFHIHLDALTIMIDLERSAFRNKLFGRNKYYNELVEWYCCVHKLYNDLLDCLGVDDSSFLHDGLKDPHRTNEELPIFLKTENHAIRYHKDVSHGSYISKVKAKKL